jgi:hypothetical protein
MGLNTTRTGIPGTGITIPCLELYLKKPAFEL